MERIVYSVKPYVNFHENIRPLDVMYAMNSYHDNDALTNGMLERTTDNVVSTSKQENLNEIINKRQLDLIEELSAFINQLNSALASYSTFPTKPQKASTKQKIPVESIVQKQFSYRKGKIDMLMKEKMGTKCVPTMTTFKPAKYSCNTITLIFGETDKQWLKYLAKIGVKDSILFEGLNDDRVNMPRCTIKLQTSNDSGSLVAKLNGTEISRRISIWKLLGALAMLYPTTPEHADICTHIDHWLMLLDDVQSGRSNEDNLCRKMSAALSRHDYLVPNVAATLADILAYSFIMKQSYYANNVQLWLRRMDELLH